MIDEKYWGEKEPDKKKDAQGPKAEEKHISVHENKIYFYSNVNLSLIHISEPTRPY